MHRRAIRFFLPKVRVTLVSIGVCLIFVCVLFAASKIFVSLNKHGLTSGNIYSILFSNGVKLASSDGRTNVLLLGVGGNGHEGGDLTDSMLILSLSDVGHMMDVVSVPRDIWSDTLKDKVNSAYHYGEEKQSGGGLVLARTIVEEITGIPIHYSLMFDFSVFSDAVDFVGGIDVNVLSPFTDTQFPIAGKENDTCDGDPQVLCRYQTISFETGLTHMDGARALQYVRSRHAEGTEGTDFARSRRQQEVLLAIRSKAVSGSNWFGMIRRFALVRTINEKTKTDMTASEILTYGKIMQTVGTNTIKKISIEQLFMNPSEELYDGKYVLVPVENYTTVHEFIVGSMKK
jgi:polyisoprenyl-teichoic acid--peptidoglycan teichoic acid transferase